MITSRFEQAGWLLAEILHRRDWWAAPRHPFYQRWSAGDLAPEELQTYAGEHHHTVVALADVCARAAVLAEGMLREELTHHHRERERDVDLWCQFAVATGWHPSAGWHYAAEPLFETEACVAIWEGGRERSLAEHLVTLYAMEAAQADVARLQLDGLLGRYGFADGVSTRYFNLRCRGDEGPAGMIAAALTGLLPVRDPFALVRQAELAYRAYWELLDGVTRCVTASASPGEQGLSPA